MNDLWIVIHRHNYGIDTRLISSDHEPTDDEVIRACHIDYEPAKGEDLEIYAVEECDITVLPAQSPA